MLLLPSSRYENPRDRVGARRGKGASMIEGLFEGLLLALLAVGLLLAWAAITVGAIGAISATVSWTHRPRGGGGQLLHLR